MHGPVFEVERGCLQYIGAEFVPRLLLGKDGVPKRLRAIPAFLSVANFENQLHGFRIAEAGIGWRASNTGLLLPRSVRIGLAEDCKLDSLCQAKLPDLHGAKML